MIKKTKAENVAQVFNILNAAKYSKLNDDERIALWKITRSMKPVATKLKDDIQDAAQHMKPSDDFDKRLALARQYEQAQRDGKEFDKLNKEDYDAFIHEWRNYSKLVDTAVKEFADEDVEINIEPITEETLSRLMASNESWTMEKAVIVSDMIMQQ
jgi:hypothetical protein